MQSLSRKGRCWDNAVGESWFATLKEELIHQRSWATIAQVRRAVIEFIEIFYNRQRLHRSLGYLTPVEFEQQDPPTPPPGGGIINLSVKPGQPHFHFVVHSVHDNLNAADVGSVIAVADGVLSVTDPPRLRHDDR